MSAKVSSVVPPVFASVVNIRPGQIGTITYGGEKVLILRTYDEIVDLNQPVRRNRLQALRSNCFRRAALSNSRLKLSRISRI
jgi:hypothetical protein